MSLLYKTNYFYKLTLSYDGTTYFGWQKTKTGPSVQESLQNAIKKISQEEILPEGASRTDRGVHALGQIASLSLQKEWDPRLLQRALNGTLPQDIRIHAVELVSSKFHPTLDAMEKEYRYRISCGPVQDPIDRLYFWEFRPPLDLAKMEKAAQDFLGRHDFTAFANAKKENPICTLRQIAFYPLPGNRLEIAITGDRFLYKMARNIAGTLLYIGCGKLPKDAVLKIISSKDRKMAGVTAPAHGLVLYRVHYLE